MPIALMIGAGSRVSALFEHLDKADSKAEIICVISHKAMQTDEQGKKTHVIGIREAQKRDIRWDYFNWIQMRDATKAVQKDNFNEETFRQDYFRAFGAFLSQKYPIKPQMIFMLGWDIVTSTEFLKYFPGPTEGLSNIINLHPGQLPDIPGQNTVKLPSGIEIPVLRGEHDEVITEAIKLRLPSLGACMHFAGSEADKGGFIIKRVEVPFVYEGTDEKIFEDYDKKLQVAESQLVLEVVDLFAQDKVLVEGTIVKIV